MANKMEDAKERAIFEPIGNKSCVVNSYNRETVSCFFVLFNIGYVGPCKAYYIVMLYWFIFYVIKHNFIPKY